VVGATSLVVIVVGAKMGGGDVLVVEVAAGTCRGGMGAVVVAVGMYSSSSLINCKQTLIYIKKEHTSKGSRHVGLEP
jgi:hypothetical protein